MNYTPELALTLPRNVGHFTEVTVVTSMADRDNVRAVTQPLMCNLLATDAFYEGGAAFNKYRAIELALDVIGRKGWLCLLDSDVALPHHLPSFLLEYGKLYGPLRRMAFQEGPLPAMLPDECTWKDYPLWRNTREWPGYCQVFNADDPNLGPPPWHELCWTHAGVADSKFQDKWPGSCKVRLPFEVLHLGPPRVHWYGKGHPLAAERMTRMRQDRQRTGGCDGEKV